MDKSFQCNHTLLIRSLWHAIGRCKAARVLKDLNAFYLRNNKPCVNILTYKSALSIGLAFCYRDIKIAAAQHKIISLQKIY